MSYLIATNPTALARSAVVRIDGLNFTVNQDGAACNYILSSAGASHGAGVENGSVDVATLPGCEWAVASGSPWITITSALNNTNSGTVNYSVSSNISVLSRTGAVSVAGQTFTVTQAPGLECSLSLLVSNGVHRAAAEGGAIGVLSPTGLLLGRDEHECVDHHRLRSARGGLGACVLHLGGEHGRGTALGVRVSGRHPIRTHANGCGLHLPPLTHESHAWLPARMRTVLPSRRARVVDGRCSTRTPG